MRRWEFALTAILTCVLGVGAGLLLRGDAATAKVAPILADKMRADRQMEPDLDAIQATYDFELRAGDPAHERDLKLVKAKCLKGQDPSYICFVSFLSAADPDGRIYNNVTEIAYIGGAWSLKTGLCKRPDGQGAAVHP